MPIVLGDTSANISWLETSAPQFSRFGKAALDAAAECLYNEKTGIALAACQAGYRESFFIARNYVFTDVGAKNMLKLAYNNKLGRTAEIFELMAHPRMMIKDEVIFDYNDYLRLLRHSERVVTQHEGCLSFPNRVFNIPRFDEISLLYRKSIDENVVDDEHCVFTGLQSRIIQHEMCHLYGLTLPKMVRLGYGREVD